MFAPLCLSVFLCFRRSISDVVIKSLLASYGSLLHSLRAGRGLGSESVGGDGGSCFQFLGFDVLLTEALQPLLIEINRNCSLKCDTPLDERIKVKAIAQTLQSVKRRHSHIIMQASGCLCTDYSRSCFVSVFQADRSSRSVSFPQQGVSRCRARTTPEHERQGVQRSAEGDAAETSAQRRHNATLTVCKPARSSCTSLFVPVALLPVFRLRCSSALRGRDHARIRWRVSAHLSSRAS